MDHRMVDVNVNDYQGEYLLTPPVFTAAHQSHLSPRGLNQKAPKATRQGEFRIQSADD